MKSIINTVIQKNHISTSYIYNLY